MNSIFSYIRSIGLLCYIAVTTINAQQYTQNPVNPTDTVIFQARDIGIRQDNALSLLKIVVHPITKEVWGVGSININNRIESVIVKQDINNWKIVRSGIYVAIGNDGFIVVIDGNNDVFYQDGKAWKKFNAIKLSNIAVYNKTLMFGSYKNQLDNSINVYFYKNNQWARAKDYDGDPAIGLQEFSFSHDAKSIVGLNQEGKVFKYTYDQEKSLEKLKNKKQNITKNVTKKRDSKIKAMVKELKQLKKKTNKTPEEEMRMKELVKNIKRLKKKMKQSK